MRIRRIGVDSVLHYDSFNLDLKEGNGLHVIYGKNEAGKSTLLNLILDILFGGQISDKSRDYYDTRSRLEGLLENPGASPVTVQRKKNRNKLVLVADTSGLTEEQLARTVGGYDRDRFMLLFGFDHDRLREGGQRLLESEGNAGISLFEAGGGIQYLQNLLEQLSNRCSALLDPRFRKGSNKTLNKIWVKYNDTKSDVVIESLPGEKWLRDRNAIEALSEQVEEIKRKLQVMQREETKLKRINRVMSMIMELQSIRRNLQDYEGVIVLTEELDLRIPQILKDQQEAMKELDRLKRNRDKQLDIVEGIKLDVPALVHAEEIEKLNDGLQQYITRTTEDLPVLEERIRTRRGDAGNLLKSIAPNVSVNEVEQLRIQYADEENIVSLAENYKQMRLDVDREQENYDKLVFEQEQIKQNLQELRTIQDMKKLRQLVREIREHGNLEESCAEVTSEIQQKQQELNRVLKCQTLWSGSLEKVSELRIPLRETIDKFHQLFEEAKQNCSDCVRDLNNIQDDHTAFNDELEKLALSGYVPVQADLDAARDCRNRGWSLVKQVWQHGLPEASVEVQVFASNASLAEAYEVAINEADHLADMMRRDSDRSANRALLQLQKAQTKRALDGLIQRKEMLEKEFRNLETTWNQEWEPCGIEPKTPAEMKDWTNTFYSPLVKGYDDVLSKELELEFLKQEIASYIVALNKELKEIQHQPQLDPGLKTLLDYCEDLVTENEERERNWLAFVNQMKVNQKNMEDQQHTLSRKREQWKGFETEWDELRQLYTALPQKIDIATAYVRELKKLFDCVNEVEDLQSQITAYQTACLLFEKKAEDLSRELADLFTCPTDVWVRSVRQRLQSAREADNRLKQIESNLSEMESDIQKALTRVSEYEVEIEQLKEKYNCKDIDDLNDLVERSIAFKAIDNSFRLKESATIQAGDGMSIEQLETELSELDHPDDLPFQLTQQERDIPDLQDRLDEEKERLTRMQIDFDKLDGSKDDAALKAQLAEQYLGEVDRYWNEYLQVELARRLFQRTIDEFREKNQSTILGKASQIFRQFTLGKYIELTVDYVDNTPYLEAIHADGTKRRVDQMSDGTRDQLFLSLRLAFVQQHLDSSDPVPLIIDDVFVNFDDIRTKAALEVLHQLAEKTQILYFTHHQSVVNMTKELKGSGRVHIYDLGNTSGVLSFS